MSSSLAAIVGGVGGAIALAIVMGFGCYCFLKHSNKSNRNSESGSSDPAAVGKVSFHGYCFLCFPIQKN